MLCKYLQMHQEEWGSDLDERTAKGNLVPSRKQVAHKSSRAKAVFQWLPISTRGGMKSGYLCALLWRILSWCTRQQVTFRARHIPGRLNVIADMLSKLGQTIQQSGHFIQKCPKLYAPGGISLKWTYLPQCSITNSHSLCHQSQTPRQGQCTHSAFPGRTGTHTPLHLQPSWASGGKVSGLPLQQYNSDCPRVAQHALVLGSSDNVQSDPTVSTQHTQPGVSAIQPGSSQEPVNSESSSRALRASAI